MAKQLAFISKLNTGAGMDDGIKWIRSTGAKFDATVHAVAVAIMRHAKENGDCSRALKLVQAMPKSARRAALINWFGHFSPINVTMAKEAKDCRVGLRKPDAKNYMPYDLDGASANPYFEWEKEPKVDTEFTSGELNTLILNMVKRVTTKLEEGKVAANDREAIEAKIASLKLAATAVAA
jgi:hypothetical protein